MSFQPRGGLLVALLALLALAACGGGSTWVDGDAPVQPKAAWRVLSDGVGAWAWGSDVAAVSLGGSDAALIGGYIGTTTLGQGTPSAVTLSSLGQQDAYLARALASSGHLLWVVTLTSLPTGYVAIQDVTETKNGIAIVGYYRGDIAFLDKNGALAAVVTGDGFDDGFVAHYDLDGNLTWVRGLTSSGYAQCLAVTSRSDGSVLVGGIFDNPMSPGGPMDTLTPASDSDSFLAVYDAAGTFLWSKQFESDAMGFVSIWSLVGLDVAGQDVIVAGDFSGTVDFTPELLLGGLVRSSVNGSIDSFILRMDGLTGDVKWVRTIGGPGSEQVQDLRAVVDGNQVQIRATGGFAGTAIFSDVVGNQVVLTSAGGHDGFVAAFNGSGGLQWAHSVGGPGEDYLYDAWVRESDGALIAIGFFTGSSSFSNSATTLTSHGTNDTDALLAGFSPGGSVDWAMAIGGETDDYGLGISGVPGEDGDVYATGMVSGTAVSFGPGTAPIGVVAPGAGFQIRFSVTP